MEAAFDYAERGYYVAAVKPRGKWRIVGDKYALPTKDPEVIREWWRVFPEANIGLPTGSAYNAWIILDVDVARGKNGIDALYNLDKQYGILLPETSVVRSGSGGLHLYYKARNGCCCRSGVNAVPGIDIRSESAHIVAPPSIHESGKRYEWIQGNLDTAAVATDDVYALAAMLGKRISEI